MSDCPCCSGKAFEACCGPFLSGQALPDTAESLMRSRFSAYARNRVEYLVQTMSKELLKDFDPAKVSRWNAKTRWKELRIHDVVAGGPEDASGEVEFSAFYEHGGRPLRLRERSLFARTTGLGGRWLYAGKITAPSDNAGAPLLEDFQPTPNTSQAKVGRNAPCPCGSGKKYKKCCGR